MRRAETVGVQLRAIPRCTTAVRSPLPPHFDVLDVRHGKEPFSRTCWGIKSENTSIGGLVVWTAPPTFSRSSGVTVANPADLCMSRCTRTHCSCTVRYNHACALQQLLPCNRCQYGPEVPLALHSAVLILSAGTPCILNSTPMLYKYNFTEYPRHECGQGQCSCIATAYRLDGSGIEFRWGRDFPHPASYAMGTGPL